MYREWLGFLSGDGLSHTRGMCVPSPIMTEPEKYAKIVFCHLPKLFQYKDYSQAEIFDTGLSDHTALCEKALRALHCVGTGTSGHVLSEETWTCLLTCLLEIGTIYLIFETIFLVYCNFRIPKTQLQLYIQIRCTLHKNIIYSISG